MKLLLAIFDERDEWEGRPLLEALIHILEGHEIAGATVLTGVTGYGTHRGVHRTGLIGLPHDKPTVLLVLESEANLRRVLPTFRAMITEGVVAMLDAEVVTRL